ncbi:MAG: hypothetical protein G01um101431_1107 [Parcubacteria group bacterium Gr01-1014_31]|nr:MAG: hypothetical protein G01um101431_1107 [Parcubacteria group bacterium Gr01-1014_31]
MRRWFSGLAILAVGVAAGWFLPRSFVPFAPAVQIPAAVPTSTASVMVDFGDGRVVTYGTIPLAAEQTVWSALQQVEKDNGLAVTHEDFGAMGVLVDGIGGIRNDAGADRFWHYWVNQRFAEVSASRFPLQPGDQVLWKYTDRGFVAEMR